MLKSLQYKKSGGNIAIIILLAWLFLIVIVLELYAADRYIMSLKADITKKDIVLSNLATYKVIDLKKLGDNPPVFNLPDPDAALNVFEYYLQKNMKLDSSLAALNNSVVVGTVSIESYIIYNVTGNQVDIYDYDASDNTFASSTVSDMSQTPVYTPTGVLVKNTSIHTKLKLNVEPMLKGIVGNTVPVEVTADTDITY